MVCGWWLVKKMSHERAAQALAPREHEMFRENFMVSPFRDEKNERRAVIDLLIAESHGQLTPETNFYILCVLYVFVVK